MTHCVGLDESCVSANDQVARATWSPKETCNLCHVRAESSAPDTHEDEDEDDQPFVQPAPRKELAEERRDPATDDEDLPPLLPRLQPPAAPERKRKGPPVWQDPTAILEQAVSRDSRERAEDTSILGRKAKRNLRDLHLKHYHMSTAQFNKRPTHLDVPGNFCDFYQHVVKTCPFCNSRKPRPERSHVSGFRADESGDLIFLDHGSAEIGDKNCRISDCFEWSHITCDSQHYEAS